MFQKKFAYIIILGAIVLLIINIYELDFTNHNISAYGGILTNILLIILMAIIIKNKEENNNNIY